MMNCLKCGRETKSEQVFCDTCLERMDAYPVRSDTPIQLPNRSAAPSTAKKPASRKKALSSEALIQQLQTTNRRLQWVILALVLALGICISVFSYVQRQALPVVGDVTDEAVTNKNYTYAPK